MGLSTKRKLLDTLHRRTVDGILVFSGFCGMFLIYRAYNFMFNVRPQIRATRRKIEEELLSEGKASEEDLSAL